MKKDLDFRDKTFIFKYVGTKWVITGQSKYTISYESTTHPKEFSGEFRLYDFRKGLREGTYEIVNKFSDYLVKL